MNEADNSQQSGEFEAKSVNKWRQAFPQFLACMIKNLLLFDLGLTIGLPTILIPVLRGYLSDHNPDETLHFSPEQSSWYGSIGLLAQICATVFAGYFTDTIGRRYTMIIVNIPHIVAWILLYCATSTTDIYISGILLGLGVGLMESAIMTYIGEISHQSIRGTLLAVSTMMGTLGIMTMCIAGSYFNWRAVSLCCVSCPILAITLLFFVPETPYWLLTKKRENEALQSLQWLRGWVPEKLVRQEFAEIREFVRETFSCDDCRRDATACPHNSHYWTRFLEIAHRKSMRPFLLIGFSFVVAHLCAMTAVRPFRVQLFKVFRLPCQTSWMNSCLGIAELIATVSNIFLVKLVGKRFLFIGSMTVAAITSIALSTNAFLTIPVDVSSFDETYVNAVHIMDNTFAMIVFVVIDFFTAVAAGMPWMLISEIFPIRVRAAASGLSAAVAYSSLFIFTKTYINVEGALSIGGAMMAYSVLTLIGCAALYMVLPETEGFSLEEIEQHFAVKQRRLTDRRVLKITRREITSTSF